MAETILGLVSTKVFNDKSWNTRSTRRKIFQTYPTGKFPLTGLLSMMDDNVDYTDSPEYGWHEQNRIEPETSIYRAAAVPFTTTGTNTAIAGPDHDFAVGDLFRLHVKDKSIFKPKHQIYVENVPITGGGVVDLHLLVESIVSGTDAIEVRTLEAVDDVIMSSNTTTGGTAGPINAHITVIGNANAEGGLSGEGTFEEPFRVFNHTQIFRNAFAATGTAIKVPTDFDKSGIYRNLAQQELTEHMTLIEKSMLFGTRSLEYVTENGANVPRRTTGGIEWFLRQYEAQDSVYRGGTGAAALTDNTDDDKRIIRPAGGALSWEFFAQNLMERLFRITGNKSFEKICMCGSGFLGVIMAYLENNKVTMNSNMKSDTVYGFNIVTWETPFGIIHFKTHPLFNNSAYRRYDAFFIDVGYAKFRPLAERDTARYKDRQGNDEDRRKDEWLTEAGLEFQHPQAHMLVKGLKSLT